MNTVDILLPTYNRPQALIMTLSGVAVQELAPRSLVVSDQSDRDSRADPVVEALIRIIATQGARVEWHHRTERLGICEQRQFLLDHSTADYVLYLDDDVFMQPWVVGRLMDTIRSEQCAFVGAFPAGLSFRDDLRPDQQAIEIWDGPVAPEEVEPGSPEWERAHLHRAANLHHVAAALPPSEQRLYKVAWVASCVLYDRRRLLEVGGFSFWPRLPRYHSGEEVLVQNLLMRRWGGCAIIPSGTYHAEVPSTVLNRHGGVDGHALDLLEDMIERYAPRRSGRIAASTAV
jgi:glycosyltransferase involved in cell wall biosynthesis